MVRQVQQRGVDGTKEILEGLLEGLDAALTKKIYLVDLLPNRFRVLLSICKCIPFLQLL